VTPFPAATLSAPASSRSGVPAPVSASVADLVASLLQMLRLTEPLPGFPRHRDYVLVPAGGAGLLYWLQSATPEGPRFLTVPAAAYFPDYAPALPGGACAELGLAHPVDARLYCLVTVPEGDVAAATANLRAPLVVNPATGRARQVVLTDGVHPIRRPMRR
jgi:flagellar assembly factor FliW